MTRKDMARMAICLALLIAVCMITSPVSADYTITAEPLTGYTTHASPGNLNNFTYDASPTGEAIQRISINIPTNTTVNFTLWYGSGSTVSGWMEYENDGFYTQHTEVALNGVTSGYSYWGLQEIGRIDIVGYAKNQTTSTLTENGFIVYDSVYGISDMKSVVFFPVASIQDNTIYKFSFGSTQPVEFAWFTASREDVGRAATKSIVEVAGEWINFALSLASFVKDTVISLFAWIKFFFWDNLGMTVALYLTITMVFAARASKGNMARFLRQWFKDQIGLFNFILSLWKTLIDIISSFRGIFRI